MKWAFRSASRAALIVGVMGASSTAWAQQAQTVQTLDETTEVEALVVTGSLLLTEPEDAAKPVEVFTLQDLKEQGSPTVTEFLRSLTSAAPNTDNMSGATAGATVVAQGRVSLNLRGQGSDGTLVLLNGRRLSAASADLNQIPMDAIGSVEVLKEGASATYGAGAVGGVVNFRTRRDVDGPELNLSRTLYADSDGAYKVNFLTGWVGSAGNLMVSATYEKEDSMLASERDYAMLPFSVNPGGWSLSNTTARFHRQTNFLTAQPTNTTIGSGGGTVGAHFNDFSSDADCAAIGGAFVRDLAPGGGEATPTLCAFSAAPWTDMVQAFTRYQVYAEGNVDISDTMELSVNASYNKYETVGNRVPGASPIAARGMDPAIATVCGTLSCRYLVPYDLPVYTVNGAATATRVLNPFIDDFNARQPGTANDVGPGMALLTSSVLRPYLFGGHPLYDYGPIRSSSQRETYSFGVGVKGRFAEDTLLGGLLNGATYDYSVQNNRYIVTYVSNGDWLANRFQDALMGYGGPDCKAIDRVATDYSSAAAFNRTIGIQSDTAPGTNGCMWFNPFQSNFQTSSMNGAVNPNFPTAGSPNWGAGATQAGNTGPQGFLNDLELIDWMWADRSTSLTENSLIFDAVISGRIPESAFVLPGGEMGWAVGAQWRVYDRAGAIHAPDQEEGRLLSQQCPYTHTGQAPQPTLPAGVRPVSRGCPGDQGTGNFYSLSRVIYPVELVTESTDFESQVKAFFGEVSLPVLDTVNLSASARHERFTTSRGGELSGTIWSVAGKWNVTDNFYARASYGTNFRATDALYLRPGSSTLILQFDNTRFGTGYNFPALTTVDEGIRPETAVTYNIGLGYQGPLPMVGGRFAASVDYWGIEITDEVVTSVALGVIDDVFKDGAPGDGSTAHQADCSARLISFIEFNNGPCQQGVTTAANVAQVERITKNGPSFNTNGIDYAVAYAYPLFGGDISFKATATQNIKFEAGVFEVNGVVFDAGGDRLGYRNTSRTGSPMTKWRGDASIRWQNEVHNIGIRANYFDGFENEPGASRTPIVNLPGTANDEFSEYGWGKKRYVDYDFNYIYTAPFWKDLALRLTILNVTDENPPAFQNFVGYDQLVGNPRGRMFRFEASKKF